MKTYLKVIIIAILFGGLIAFLFYRDIKNEVMEYFERFKMFEPIKVDIGNTGDISAQFKGISPVTKSSDNGTDYYFVSVLLQETGKVPPSDEEMCETCSNCGFH